MLLKRRHLVLFSTAFLVLALTAWALLTNNIHTVIPNQVYRSAQLGTPTLKKFIHQRHIQSVFNLRGIWKHDQWYQQETTLTKQLGVNQYDVKLHADSFPKLHRFKRLVNLLQTAPTPMLLHCRRGADRTSLASAIVIILNGEPLEVAEKQIGLRYGVVKQDSIGYLVFNKYKQWLHDHHMRHSKQTFLAWVTRL